MGEKVIGSLKLPNRVDQFLDGTGNFTSPIRTLADFYADVANNNGITAETVLYSVSIPANTLQVNGDKIEAFYALVFASNSNTKNIYVDFAGARIFASGGLSQNGFGCEVEVRIMRVSSNAARCSVKIVRSGSCETVYTLLSSVNFATALDLKLVGEADSNGDVTAKFGTVRRLPGLPPDTQAPTVPGSFGATVVSDSQIGLSWTASTDNVSVASYELQRALDPAFTTGLTTITPGNVTSYSDTSLAQNTTYYYRVRATDGANPSNWSNVLTKKTFYSMVAGFNYRWRATDLALADNDPVASWTDSVAAAQLTQSGSLRPTFKTGISPTGKPGVRFDGVDDYIGKSSGVASYKHVFVVAAYRGSGPETAGLLGSASGGSYYWRSEAGTSPAQFQYAASFGAPRRDGVNTSLIATGGQTCVYSIDLASADSGSLYLAIDRLIAGTEGPWDVFEVVTYATSRSGAEIAQIEAALAEYWITG